MALFPRIKYQKGTAMFPKKSGAPPSFKLQQEWLLSELVGSINQQSRLKASRVVSFVTTPFS